MRARSAWSSAGSVRHLDTESYGIIRGALDVECHRTEGAAIERLRARGHRPTWRFSGEQEQRLAKQARAGKRQ
jgi:hypothetical protein